MTTNETLSRSDLLTDCERSMRYHHARERFFDGAHSFIQFLVFASSSTGGGVLLLGEFSAESVSAVALGAVSLLALLSLVGILPTRENCTARCTENLPGCSAKSMPTKIRTTRPAPSGRVPFTNSTRRSRRCFARYSHTATIKSRLRWTPTAAILWT